MSLQATISKLLGITERIEKAVPAADVLTGLNAQIATLTAENVTLKARDAGNAVQLAESAKRVGELEADLKTSKDSQSDFDAKVEKAASSKAAAIAASQGIPPVGNLPKETPGKPAEAKLVGLAKVEAAFRAEREAAIPKRN